MNLLFIAKLVISAALIAAATEVAKRYPFWGAVIIVLPLTTVLAMSWLYIETRDNALVSQFARDVFFLVPLSLLFFVPFLFEPKTHWGFGLNLTLGLVLLAGAALVLRRFIP